MEAFSKTCSKLFSNQVNVLRRGFAKGAGLTGKDKITKKDGKLVVEFGNQYKFHKCSGLKNVATTDKDELLKYFREMTLMRRVELTADNLYKQKLIRGFLHLYNGQEAIVVGSESAITKQDHVITAYRNHSHYLGRGGTPREALAELMGKATGCAHGKGGSMHMYKADANYHGGNGIVGAQCPIGAGIAFALKYQNLKNVCLTSYGDGAANQGQLFEAFNMAQLWKLPVIFICENNKYGMGTSAERSSASIDYYTRGDFVPGVWVDAMNVLAVREAVRYAKEHALTTGPIVLEMETYRYYGHSMSDPGISYRTKDEVTSVESERDPISKVKNMLLSQQLATEEELSNIDKDVRKEVNDALKQAKDDPFPEPIALFQDVYDIKSRPYYVRGVDLESGAVVQ